MLGDGDGSAAPVERADSGPTERTTDEPVASVHDVDTAPVAASEPAPVRPSSRAVTEPPVRPLRREAQAVYVIGFWKRLAAALVDFSIVVPAALLITWIVSKVACVHLPPSNLRLRDLDMWIDLVLATDPALIMGVVLMLAVGMTYLLVFHIVLGRTLGMRLLKMKIIDVYGERPSPARCVARCGGYLAGVATLFLGFLWMGFDSEKRGLQDWIAGTYVIRA